MLLGQFHLQDTSHFFLLPRPTLHTANRRCTTQYAHAVHMRHCHLGLTNTIYTYVKRIWIPLQIETGSSKVNGSDTAQKISLITVY